MTIYLHEYLLVTYIAYTDKFIRAMKAFDVLRGSFCNISV